METEWDLALKKLGIVKQEKNDQPEDAEELDFYKCDKVDIMDSDDELERIRKNRLKNLKEYHEKAKFGSVIEITAADYVSEVNRAGDDIWVILHLYQNTNQKCRQINAAMDILAPKYPMIKFIRSVSTKCVQNYPEESLPTIFIYQNDKPVAQYIGPVSFGNPKSSYSDVDMLKMLKRHKCICDEDDLSDSE